LSGMAGGIGYTSFEELEVWKRSARLAVKKLF
jgi:hypothetical protein